MLCLIARAKLGQVLLTCDLGHFNQRPAQNQKQTLFTVASFTCITTVPFTNSHDHEVFLQIKFTSFLIGNTFHMHS